MAGGILIRTATIANGDTISGAVQCSGMMLAAIQLPSAMTGTSLTFEAETPEGGGFDAVYDSEGTLVSYTIAASRVVVPAGAAVLISGVDRIRVVSNASEGAERTIQLSFVETNR